MNFSIEITMKTDLSELPKVKDVYITMLPGNDYREVAAKAIELATPITTHLSSKSFFLSILVYSILL